MKEKIDMSGFFQEEEDRTVREEAERILRKAREKAKYTAEDYLIGYVYLMNEGIFQMGDFIRRVDVQLTHLQRTMKVLTNTLKDIDKHLQELNKKYTLFEEFKIEIEKRLK